MTRAHKAVKAALGALLLFAACVTLTPNGTGGKGAGATGGSESSDVAAGASGGSSRVATDAESARAGGSVASGGATTSGGEGASTTGGTGGTETDGAAKDLEPDAGVAADGSGDSTIDVPFSTDTNLPVDQRTGDTTTGDGRTGGTGGTATGGTRTGGTGGRATGGAGGTSVVDAAADATSSGDVGIDAPADTILPSDLGTGGADGAGPDGAGDTSDAGADSAGTGGAGGAGGTGTGGAGGAGGTGGTGGTGTGGTTGSVIISIDFVGGGPTAPGMAMALTESAGVKWVANWNSAWNATGSLSPLLAADGSTTSASVNWNAPLATGETYATWTVPFSDNTGDAHMMNGYLDPRNASPATIDVTLPSSMSGGFDVYVYCYGNSTTGTRTYQYSIGSASQTVSQVGASATSFPGYTLAPEGGEGNYFVFRNLTATTFTLNATPGGMTGSSWGRAPVNGIQIVYPAGS